MNAPIPAALSQGGTLSRRQTSFWELVTRIAPGSWRVHFVEPWFPHATLTTDHPSLTDHVERVLAGLKDGAERQFDHCRSVATYPNPDYPAQRLLAEGAGMLARAPRSLVEACTNLLVRHRVRVDPSRGLIGAIGSRALVLDDYFLVASSFRFEQLEADGAAVP